MIDQIPFANLINYVVHASITTTSISYYNVDTSPAIEKSYKQALVALGDQSEKINIALNFPSDVLNIQDLSHEVKRFLEVKGITIEFLITESIIRENFRGITKDFSITIQHDPEIVNTDKLIFSPKIISGKTSIKEVLVRDMKSKKRIRRLLSSAVSNNFLINPQFI